MSHKERLDVFISSTSYDLPEHRKAVVEAILSLNLQPRGMEYWAVTGDDPVVLCKHNVREADAFIGIYAYRYGWCPNDYSGKSITEMEYDWAETVISDGNPIPRFCFIMDEAHPITIEMVELEKKTEMEAFKNRVRVGHHIGFFRSVDDLKAQVIQALAHWSVEKHLSARKTDEHSPKQASTSTTSETKKQKYIEIIVNKIDTGATLINIIAGSHAHHMVHDDLQNDAEVELIGSFIQNISDYGDLWDDLGPYERTRAQLELHREIESIGANGFLVYGCQQNESHRYTIGNKVQVVKLQVLYIFVLRQSNPRVRRSGELETAMGFKSQEYSGAFAPFLVYVKPI